MIQAILFDMDGVLIDAKEWHYEALNCALRLFGMSIPRMHHLSSFDGLPTKRKLELLSMEYGLPTQLHSFLHEMKQKYTMEIVHTRCKPRFDHHYALSNLRARGYRMAVCSNSVRNSVETMMHLSGLAEYVDFLVSNEDVAHPKPAPDMYHVAMKRFKLDPSQCLIVEDNEHGIQAAKATGAHLLVVKNVADVNLSNILRHIEKNL